MEWVGGQGEGGTVKFVGFCIFCIGFCWTERHRSVFWKWHPSVILLSLFTNSPQVPGEWAEIWIFILYIACPIKSDTRKTPNSVLGYIAVWTLYISSGAMCAFWCHVKLQNFLRGVAGKKRRSRKNMRCIFRWTAFLSCYFFAKVNGGYLEESRGGWYRLLIMV